MWLYVRVWVVGGGRGVAVDVTPTPSNAPDPEQMARQGLSAEPELIACAMSYCLRRSPLPILPPLLPTPDFCTPALPPPLFCLTLFPFFISFLYPHTSLYSSGPSLPPIHPITSPPTPHLIPCCTPLPPSSQSALLFQALVRLIHSLVHPFIYSRAPSFISLFSRHSFTGWPTRRGFITRQLRHLCFQSSPAECLPPRFLTRLFTP